MQSMRCCPIFSNMTASRSLRRSARCRPERPSPRKRSGVVRLRTLSRSTALRTSVRRTISKRRNFRRTRSSLPQRRHYRICVERRPRGLDHGRGNLGGRDGAHGNGRRTGGHWATGAQHLRAAVGGVYGGVRGRQFYLHHKGLRTQCRHEPVQRKRDGEGRQHLGEDSRALLPEYGAGGKLRKKIREKNAQPLYATVQIPK